MEIITPFPDYAEMVAELSDKYGGDMALLREIQKHLPQLPDSYRTQIHKMKRGLVKDPAASTYIVLQHLSDQPAVSSGLAELREVVAGLQAEVAALRTPGKRADKPAEPPQPAGEGGYDPAWPAEQVKRLALFLAGQAGKSSISEGIRQLADQAGMEQALSRGLVYGTVATRKHCAVLDGLAEASGFIHRKDENQ